MFDNKSLELASYGHLDFYYFQSFLSHFNNASLVNLNGDLLYSKDQELCSTTTSRLVAYQIAKKYLKLHSGDIFITNDPENGGFSYSKIFFISCLTQNLYLIWTEDLEPIQFKIPLSPLCMNHTKNEMLWSALIDVHPEKMALTDFFEAAISHYTSCFRATPYLDFISEPDFQNLWFSTCLSEFERQFDQRAQGQSQIGVQFENKNIRVNLNICEKQNVKCIEIDFSGTQVADQISAASHVIESAMIQEFVYHYKLHQYLSQPILNYIKLTMPPKSVVSKAHVSGQYNFELQRLIKQIFKHLLSQLNISKKKEAAFCTQAEAQLTLIENTFVKQSHLLDQRFMMEEWQDVAEILMQNMKDNHFQARFKIKSDHSPQLHVGFLNSTKNDKQRNLKINDRIIKTSHHRLKAGDVIELNWQI